MELTTIHNIKWNNISNHYTSRPRPPIVQKIAKIGNVNTYNIFNAPSIKIEDNETSYTEFMEKVNSNNVESVDIYANDLHGKFITKDGDSGTVQLIPSDRLIDDFLSHEINVKYIRKDDNNMFLELLGYTLRFIGIMVIIQLIASMISGNSSNPFNMKKSIGKTYDADKDNAITFDNVAGIDNSKRELEEVVRFLKNGDKFIEVGARIPKGVLLIGPPGTGKTLLAKAVAGEAGVPFYSCSASEFIEMFVGLGASRIRELFKKANNTAPCIIFIDEIDAIGRQRSSGGYGGSNDEREQTINQLLTEMDGFENNNGVIVIAATNRAELLDEALVRPGRFDRQVYVELPDFTGRKAILELHTKNKNIDNIDINSIARMTMGFSGADLENLCNEAAIYAVSKERTKIIQQDFDEVFDKILMGPIKDTVIMTDLKKQTVAYHEAGHTLMGILLGDYDQIHKVSIVPRGGAGGVTYFQQNEERTDMGLYTREYLENRLMVLLGGRIAEEIKFGTMKVTTGASHDFSQATSLVSAMVSEYGFNETIGYINANDASLANGMNSDISVEVRFYMERIYIKASNLMNMYRSYLDDIAVLLLEKETINHEDLLHIINGISCEYSRHDKKLFINDYTTPFDE